VSGKWLAKVPIGKTPKGKTRYITKTCATKSEARHWHSEILVLRQSRMLVAGPRQTLRQYATEMLLNGNDRISDRTSDGYFRSLRKHVFPVFGSYYLTDIRPQELELFFIQLRRDHAASTVNNIRVALSKVLTTAMRHGLVLSNPVGRTQKAKQGEFDRTQVRLPWSQEELQKILAAARDTPMEAFLNLALATGMRLGELLGLRWNDVDFENKTVSIQRTIHRESVLQVDGTKRRGVVVAPPKTPNSRRVNQLSDPVLDILRRHQLEQEVAREMAGNSWQSLDYVFTNNQGGPIDDSNFRKKYVRFLKKSGQRYVRIHDLRHTFATILIEENSGQLASVSQALGHSSLAITMDRYAKTAKVETQATSRMSEIMFPDRGRVAPIRVPAPGKVGSIPPGFRRAV